MVKYLLLLYLGCLWGCSSIPSKSELFLKQTNLNLKQHAKKHTIPDVPYLLQKQNHCGPATLAMVLNRLGNLKTPTELAQMSFSTKAKGTYKEDLISAARIEGYTTIPVRNYSDLVLELAANNPVIVFQNLGFNWYPLWHYALVYGYDLDQKTLTMHTGADQAKEVSFNIFDKSWKRGDYWGVTITLPKELSKTGTELDHIRSAAALENNKKYELAKIVYQQILTRWPQSYMSYFGLGNIDFYANHYQKALNNYDTVLKINPKMSLAWYNKALIYEKLKNYPKARLSAKKALDLAPTENKIIYKKNLEPLLINK